MAKAKYTEPSDYIPKDIRKELKLGEFAEEEQEEEKRVKEKVNKDIKDYINRK